MNPERAETMLATAKKISAAPDSHRGEELPEPGEDTFPAAIDGDASV